MPRDKFDIFKDIYDIKNKDYTAGFCINCDKKMKPKSEKVVEGYDVCWKCDALSKDPADNRIMAYIHELEIIAKR